jgi:enoyl-CoA hydratase/carnithine racemase
VDYTTIRCTTAHGILTVTLDRPDHLNSFTPTMARVATALMRQMIYRNSAQPDPLAAHRLESLAMFYTSIGDGKEGVQAFLEKRAPHFTGRISTDMPPF